MKLKNNVKLLVTCDSGAGAGKTTAAKYLSKKFGLALLTSGLLYRYVAYRLIVAKKTTNENFGVYICRCRYLSCGKAFLSL